MSLAFHDTDIFEPQSPLPKEITCIIHTLLIVNANVSWNLEEPTSETFA